MYNCNKYRGGSWHRDCSGHIPSSYLHKLKEKMYWPSYDMPKWCKKAVHRDGCKVACNSGTVNYRTRTKVRCELRQALWPQTAIKNIYSTMLKYMLIKQQKTVLAFLRYAKMEQESSAPSWVRKSVQDMWPERMSGENLGTHSVGGGVGYVFQREHREA